MLNQFKTFILLAVLTAILLAIGQLVGGLSGLYVAIVIALLINVLSYWYSDKLVLKMYRAQPASETEYKELHDIVRDVSSRAGIPKPKVYVVPANHANAFATGRNPKNSAIAVTQGILDLLSEEELKGVLAHEIAHIKNRDILISTIAAVIAGAISYIAFFARFGAIFGGMGRDRESGNILALLALAIVAPIIALIVRLAISRSREYLADSTGARIIHNPLPLADALAKLNTSSKMNPLKKGNEATAHMFIVNPFSGKSILQLFSTHPNVQSRIGKLRSMKF